ncbi:PEGA domain-containing protein [Gemmatimonadota bacterium]
MRKLAFLFVLVPLVALLSGCATIVSSGPTDLTFRSSPSGADVVVNGDPKGEEPVTLGLHAEKDNLVTFHKDGCDDLTLIPRTSAGVGYIVADFFLPFGLIVDLITQEWQTFPEKDITGHMDCS